MRSMNPFVGTQDAKNRYYYPALVALWEHVIKNPVLPLTSLKLGPDDLEDFSSLEGREHLQEILERKFGREAYFPFPFKLEDSGESNGLYSGLFQKLRRTILLLGLM